MMETHIYIAVDSCSSRISKKSYAYILECTVSGEPVTKEGYGHTEGSYHKAVLDALAEALERFNKKSKITIHTEDEFVLNMINNNMPAWKEKGFITAKGKPLANQEEWIRISKAAEEHMISTEAGKHEYSVWLKSEMERRKEQNV